MCVAASFGRLHHQHRADGEVGGDEDVGAAHALQRGEVAPLVPTTQCTPASRQRRALWSAVSGWVKSTTTSAAEDVLERQAQRQVRAPDELHVLGALDRCADRWPIRPAAPETATRITPRRRSSGFTARPRARTRPRSRRRPRPTSARGRTARAPAPCTSSEPTASTAASISSRDSSGTPVSTPAAEPVHARQRGLQRQRGAPLHVLLRALELVGGHRSGDVAFSSAAITSIAWVMLSGRVPT